MPPKRRHDGEAAAGTDQDFQRHKSAVDEAFDELVCPITQSLPVDPVTAEDGKVYERSAIVEWLAKNERSPLTNEPMGPRLQPALSVKNLIRQMVTSGAITGDKADAWLARLKDEEVVKGWRLAAEEGDGVAMFLIGTAYSTGVSGVAQDKAQALEWYRRAHVAGCASGTAHYGAYIAEGRGGATASVAMGAALMGEAAARGSRFACAILGHAFAYGVWGFPKEPEMARHWYTKVAGAETIDDSPAEAVDRAAKWLSVHPA